MPAEIQTAFSTVLRRFREERKMSQEDLAFESNVGRVSIAMMETGKRLPTLPTLFRLARGLSVRPGEFVEAVSAETRAEDERASAVTRPD